MTSDLCRDECDRVAAECPDDSFAAEAAEFCRAFCGAFVNSAECREKFETLSECAQMNEPACDIGTSSPCEAESEPFAIDGTGEGNSGECVDE